MKERCHLGFRFQVVIGSREPHPIGIVDRSPRLYTEEYIVKLAVLCSHIVDIIGRNKSDVVFF